MTDSNQTMKKQRSAYNFAINAVNMSKLFGIVLRKTSPSFWFFYINTKITNGLPRFSNPIIELYRKCFCQSKMTSKKYLFYFLQSHYKFTSTTREISMECFDGRNYSYRLVCFAWYSINWDEVRFYIYWDRWLSLRCQVYE